MSATISRSPVTPLHVRCHETAGLCLRRVTASPAFRRITSCQGAMMEPWAPCRPRSRSTPLREVVYALVADVTRTGEWSPECVRCRWLGGATAPVAGARYRGDSRNGWRRWSTNSTIRVARPGAELVWDVTYLRRPVARWGYRLTAHDGGRTLLVESVEDHRERWLQVVSPWITGSSDRAARNADTIQTTLQRIKNLAEQSAQQAPSA